MQMYPLSSPPSLPGIYALTNRLTGQIYIGKSNDLRRRYQEWRATFVSGLGHKNPILRAAVTDPGDWAFYVVEELPQASELDLLEREAAAMRTALKNNPANIVLNVMLPTVIGGTARAAEMHACKTTILDDAGRSISYAEAAAALGRSRERLQKCLARYRDRGRCEVTLEHLRKASARYFGATKNTGQ